MWEALALLAAIRMWRLPQHSRAVAHVRSDSLGALLSIAKGASTHSTRLNLILQELALEDAEFNTRIAQATHIPGLANDWADALSRLWAPSPKHVPVSLASAKRVRLPSRSRDWYLTLRPLTHST